MIPKVINYCWFGRGEKSGLIKKCIASWEKYCPDWEITEWNEDNFDVDFCAYSKKAYKEKRYGFVSDAARQKIIYERGGAYFDTDCEFIAPIDELLDNKAFFAYSMTRSIGTGLGFGAEKGSPVVKRLLDEYVNYDVRKPFVVCTEIDTKVFKEYYPEFAADHNIEQIFDDGTHIYNNIWKYSIHHYTSTWMTPFQKFETKALGVLPKPLRENIIKLRRKLLRRDEI